MRVIGENEFSTSVNLFGRRLNENNSNIAVSFYSSSDDKNQDLNSTAKVISFT